MVKIEYANSTVNVPQSWADITLGTYEKVQDLEPKTPRERVDRVAVLCGVAPALLLGWPADIFNMILERIDFVFADPVAQPSPKITVAGVDYFVSIEDKLPLAEWIDADEVQKPESEVRQNGTGVIANVLAIVCRPIGEEYDYLRNAERAAMFSALPMSDVMGVMAFFLRYSLALRQHTLVYTALMQIVGRLPLTMRSLRKCGAGIKWYRIWPMAKYLIIVACLRYRLHRHLQKYNTEKIKR